MRRRRISPIITNIAITAAAALLLMALPVSMPVCADNGLPADYVPNEGDNRDLSDNDQIINKYGIPWHQFKNTLTDETIEPQALTVDCQVSLEGLGLVVYNSTTQETEAIIAPDDSGKIQLPRMKRGHTYILMSNNSSFQLEGQNNVYLWALAKGDQGVAADGAYEHKTGYIRLSEGDPIPQNYLRLPGEIKLKRVQPDYFNPRFFSIHTNLPITYNGKPAPEGIKLTLTSEENDPIEVSTERQIGKTIIRTDLIEDTDYTVHVNDDRYDVETFALTVKDKSEHKYMESGVIKSLGRYTYDHTCCQGVNAIELKDRSDVTNNGSISSLKKYKNTDIPLTKISGMDFKTLLLLVRNPKISLPENSDISDYETVELTLVNPHRWEKCKITEHEFTVTQMLSQRGTVKNVYQLKDGKLEALSFTQSNKESVEFRMNSISLYNVVIEYSSRETDPELEPDTQVTTPAGTSIKKIKSAKKKFTVTWRKRSGASGYQIQYGTKKSFRNVKTVTIKSAKVTKRTIKNLKSKRRYYVRIRTYKTVSGKNHYSPWSRRKAVKVK